MRAGVTPYLFWVPDKRPLGEEAWIAKHGHLRFDITRNEFTNGTVLFQLKIEDSSRSVGIMVHFEDMWDAREAARLVAWGKGE